MKNNHEYIFEAVQLILEIFLSADSKIVMNIPSKKII